MTKDILASKMNVSELSKSLIVSFLASIVVTLILWFFLYTLHIEYITYLSALVGMYVFAGFGVNRLVEDNVVENNASRFILAIVCIVIYAAAFLYIMPMVFGPDVFAGQFNLANYGIGLDMPLSCEMMLAIFAVIVLVLNFMDYRN